MPSISLRQALLADQGMSRCITTPKWEAERLKDGAIPWPMLSDALVECRDGLAHLDEESFAYYLGGFLRFAVNHLDASLLSPEDELLGSVVFSVTQRSNYNLGRLKRKNHTHRLLGTWVDPYQEGGTVEYTVRRARTGFSVWAVDAYDGEREPDRRCWSIVCPTIRPARRQSALVVAKSFSKQNFNVSSPLPFSPPRYHLR